MSEEGRFIVPSQGELSKKLSDKLPLDVWVKMYQNLLNELSNTKSKNKKAKKLLKSLKIVSFSIFQASLFMTWAEHKTTANGFKLHMMIDSNLVL